MPRPPTAKLKIIKRSPLWIKCPFCGYKWSPDPRKWRNWSLTYNHEKVLTCPSCSSRIRLSTNVLKDILKHRGFL